MTEAFEMYKASIERESNRKPSSKKNRILIILFIFVIIFYFLQEILTEREKKLKALIKKREQIKGLIEKQAKGEKLEKNQVILSF